MKQEEVEWLLREAERDLKRYPGVVGVAWGQKRRGGKPTGETGFCVYVLEKKDASHLKPEDVLPPEYRGLPIDVDPLPSPVKVAECTLSDHDTHSPLIGGITITNLRPDATGNFGVGTLGFFATINGVDPPDNVALVTNHHIATANGAGQGATIYQQPLVESAPGVWAVSLTPRNPIGTILRTGTDGNVPFEGEQYFVDCTSVKINICISSWCNTNCGESIRNEIRSLDVNGNNEIVDVVRVLPTNIPPAASAPYRVFKVGRATGRTEGVVSRVNLPVAGAGQHVIEITATAPNCHGALQFIDEGDSGSALINAEGKLIGMLFAYERTNPVLSYACDIGPVQDHLGITPITRAHLPDARVMRSEVESFVAGRPNQTPWLRDRFLASPLGQRLGPVIERLRHEVVHLVNHNRRVMVAWHRHQGPAFLNRAINNARDPEVLIPWQIDGVTRTELLSHMARVLMEHGSPALRAAIERHADEVLAGAETFDSLHELVDRLVEQESV